MSLPALAAVVLLVVSGVSLLVSDRLCFEWHPPGERDATYSTGRNRKPSHA